MYCIMIVGMIPDRAVLELPWESSLPDFSSVHPAVYGYMAIGSARVCGMSEFST